MSEPYEILSVDDLGRYAGEGYGESLLMPLRQRLDLRAFGANCWTTAGPGQRIVPEHEEGSGNEELYVVVRGRATFTVDGETLDAPAGTLVHVTPGERRTAFAEEADTVVLAVGGTVGQPFEVHGWDEVLVAFSEARDGNVERGRAIMEAVAAKRPGFWGPLYNLACFEARFGDGERAFERLREAFAASPDDVRGWAARDDDLESLHEDPRWQELFG
jgi:Cupin domain